MKNIKFIYFDVGGVLIRDFTNTNKWQSLKSDLGVTRKTDEAFEQVWQKYRSRINLDLDVDLLIPELADAANLQLPTDYSLLHDFVRRFAKNPSIWPVVKEAQIRCKVGLLTNMFPRMLSLIKEDGIVEDVKWDIIIDSSVVLLQKPDSAIFSHATKESGFKKAEILFVDNLERNTLAAKEFGWQVFFYDDQNPEKASEELKEFICN